MDVETTQIAVACLGIVAAQKNVESEKSGLSRGFRRTCIKEAAASAQRVIKYSSSEGDQVFLLPLELSPFFGDFFEVVLQATSAMLVTNYPRGYTPK